MGSTIEGLYGRPSSSPIRGCPSPMTSLALLFCCWPECDPHPLFLSLPPFSARARLGAGRGEYHVSTIHMYLRLCRYAHQYSCDDSLTMMKYIISLFPYSPPPVGRRVASSRRTCLLDRVVRRHVWFGKEEVAQPGSRNDQVQV